MLTYLGADGNVGGGDDRAIPVLPRYQDGSTNLTLSVLNDLQSWSAIDYGFPNGVFGNWQVSTSTGSATETLNGGPTFFVSGDNSVDNDFAAQLLVSPTTDNDYIGVVVGFQVNADTGLPNTYYLLAWKLATSDSAPGGMRLVKVTDTGQIGQRPDLWQLSDTDPHVAVLATGPATGWSPGIPYEVHVSYQTNGALNVSIADATSGTVLWNQSVVDSVPLGVGKTGFYNFSQADANFWSLKTFGTLDAGKYQLKIIGSSTGLLDVNGNPIDGDHNGSAGGDYVGNFTIDIGVPTVNIDLQTSSDTGISSSDNLTRIAAPQFDITSNRSGTVELYIDGATSPNASLAFAGAGTQVWTAPTLTNATHHIIAKLVPALGNAVSQSIDVVIDTAPPTLLAGLSSVQGPVSQRQWHFSEPIDFDRSQGSGLSVTIGGPQGTYPITDIVGSGADYTLSFPLLAVGGPYTVSANDKIWDLAGNQIVVPPADPFTLVVDTTPPTVTSFSPVGPRNGDVNSFSIGFSEAIVQTSFDPSDVVFYLQNGGTVTPASISLDPNSDSTFTTGLATPFSDEGIYRVDVGPTISDLSGNLLTTKYTATVTIDKTGPQVISISPSGTVNARIDHVDVTFNEPVQQAVANAFALSGPNGSLAASGVQKISDTLYRVTFPSQSRSGNYQITVGPSVLDLAGNDMTRNAPGEFVGQFTIELADLVIPSESVVVPPSAVFGSTIQVEWTDKNFGSLAASAGWSDRLWLSQDSIAGNSGDVLLATVPFDASALPLVPGAAQRRSTTLALPSGVGLPDGDYHVVIETGIGLGQPELDNTNNVAASSEIALTHPFVRTLSISLSAAQITEGNSVVATITRNDNIDQPLAVTLAETNIVSALSQFTLPPVLFLGGQQSIDVTLMSNDDSLIEKTKDVKITVSALGYVSNTAHVVLVDNDIPTLSLSIDPATFSEAAGTAAATGTVTRSLVSDQPLTVKLYSSDGTEASVPVAIVIPANQASATFSVAALDDTFFDGTQTVAISANGAYPECGCTITQGGATVSVQVTDDEGPSLALQLGRTSAFEGTVFTATVTRTGDLSQAIDVQLSSSDVTEATALTPVTIPAGADSTTFEVTTLDDAESDGRQTVTLTASAAGLFDGTATFNVLDRNVPDLVVSSIFVPSAALTDQNFNITYRITNNGVSPASGTWKQQVFLSSDDQPGNDTLVGTFEVTATLPPGISIDRTISVHAPTQTGNRWIVVREDVEDSIVESDENNNITVSAAVPIQAEYTATVSTDVAVAKAGTNVQLHGHAMLAGSSAPAQFKLVNVHILVRGTERVISAVTNALGDFSITFKPIPGEAGNYTIFATHPGVATGSAQDQFALIGFAAVPTNLSLDIIESQSAAGEVMLRNQSEVSLTGLSVTIVSQPDDLIVLPELGDGTANPTLAAGAEIPLSVAAMAMGTGGSGNLILRVTSAEGASIDIPITVNVIALVPHLVADPAQLQFGMLRGQQTIVSFTATNDGGAETGQLTLDLPSVFPWLTSATNQIPSIQPGGTAEVVLQLLPPADLPLLDYTGTLVLRSATAALVQPFTFSALSSAIGGLRVTVNDEYTFFADGAPRVAGANVVVKSARTGAVISSGVTDTNGQVLLADIPEDYYTLEVNAAEHTGYRNSVLIRAGSARCDRIYLARPGPLHLDRHSNRH